MLVPVELKQEIIFFFFLSALLTCESRGEDEKKSIYRANTSPCLPPLSYGDGISRC